MSYQRDRDRVTRGVGAIAAMDHAMPARARMRQRSALATHRRDRAMAKVAQGALGLVPLIATLPQSSNANASTTGWFKLPTPAAPPTTANAITSGFTLPVAQPPSSVRFPTPPPRPPTQPPVMSNDQGPRPIDPLPLPPAPAPTSPAVPVISPAPIIRTVIAGGGGGGSGVVMGSGSGSGNLTAIMDPVPHLPDLPEGAEADHTTRNLLIVGGAALAAYLLFLRGRPS